MTAPTHPRLTAPPAVGDRIAPVSAPLRSRVVTVDRVAPGGVLVSDSDGRSWLIPMSRLLRCYGPA